MSINWTCYPLNRCGCDYAVLDPCRSDFVLITAFCSIAFVIGAIIYKIRKVNKENQR